MSKKNLDVALKQKNNKYTMRFKTKSKSNKVNRMTIHGNYSLTHFFFSVSYLQRRVGSGCFERE
jgi:hypothetical protein